MSQQSATTQTYTCPICNKIKLYKTTFEQHMLLCNYREHVNIFKSQYTEKERNETTTIQELLAIITRQEQQIQRMTAQSMQTIQTLSRQEQQFHRLSNQLSQINQTLNRQERRNICEHLNKTETHFQTFTDWIADIEISFSFILSMCQTDIRDALLERFRKYYNSAQSQHGPIPIKAFVENRSKIYIYDIEPVSPATTKWFILTNDHLGKIVCDIYKKWKKTFAKWMMENEDEFDVNYDMNEMKQAFMNKMDRYNHLSEKEKIVKIKNWVVEKVETNMPQIVVIDA